MRKGEAEEWPNGMLKARLKRKRTKLTVSVFRDSTWTLLMCLVMTKLTLNHRHLKSPYEQFQNIKSDGREDWRTNRVKKSRPYLLQCSRITSRMLTDLPSAWREARMETQQRKAQIPSFSRMWFEPVPKLSSPHTEAISASKRLPKNFQPVGVSKTGMFFALHTLHEENNSWVEA